MREKALQKDADRNWIQIGERICNFVVSGHVLSEPEIFKNMDCKEKIRKFGYFPDTSAS